MTAETIESYIEAAKYILDTPHFNKDTIEKLFPESGIRVLQKMEDEKAITYPCYMRKKNRERIKSIILEYEAELKDRKHQDMLKERELFISQKAVEVATETANTTKETSKWTKNNFYIQLPQLLFSTIKKFLGII